MTDPEHAQALLQDAADFARKAVQYDQAGQVDTAVFYYTEAVQALLSATRAGSQAPGLAEKVNEYITRGEQLRSQGSAAANRNSLSSCKSQHQLDTDRAKYLLDQAFEEDGSGNKEEAFELYAQAAELFLKLRNGTPDKAQQTKIEKLAAQALDRAEQLKVETQLEQLPAGASDPSALSPPSASSSAAKPAASPQQQRRAIRPLGFSLQDEDKSPSHKPRSSGATSGGGGYTKEELQVLRVTSRINEREYVPFLSVDTRERFAYPVPFSDRMGKLALSPKQQAKFSKWVRPEEFLDNPQMILAVSSFTIKQTIVSDCSFVASLAISAQYERRFKKKLITSIIYPQNRNGDPQVNPCGKYMVKLNINGVHRKVIIDDFLPMSHHGDLLCSYSNNRNELWVSLLEKAYMKVMGGYDFPGSNSNIDLHALTGWIPERIAIRPGSDEFDAEKEFVRICDRFHKGHCLVTMATGDMSEAAADRAGLVPTHAYAMLDIRPVKGHKLFQLKNPWSHLRWKGNFSEKDTQHWTPDMQKACNYDPSHASQFDNGVFWIDYESIQKFFDVIYINWNPELFPHTTCMHHTWSAKEGPKKDAYNIGDNPQYKLEVRGQGAVWILLTRHITDKEDFANNREFITVLVYKSSGKRVFYPYDPPPYRDGVRINSPHYLCKLVEDTRGTSVYTLVVSQYEKSNTIHYTLRVYSTADFSLNKISEPYVAKYEKQVTGQWKGKTAGGCGNYPETFQFNPIFQLKIDNNSTTNMILVELRGPKQYGVGFEVVCVAENVTNSPSAFKRKTSGDFRRGFCVLELENVVGGVYNIRPCTFHPGKEGPFILTVSASAHTSLTQLQ